MAFTDNPLSLTDRMRLVVGDIDPDNPLVSDQWYQYFYDQLLNEKTAAIEVAKKILAQYTSHTRERAGQVEIYGNEAFKNYLEWLKDIISDPSLSILGPATPYAGGISVQDFCDNNNNPDNIRPFKPARCSPNGDPYYTVFKKGNC